MYVNMTAIQADVLVSNKVNIPGGESVNLLVIHKVIFNISDAIIISTGVEAFEFAQEFWW